MVLVNSNIVSVFELLSDLFDTMNVRDFLESLLSRKDIDTKNQQFMMKYSRTVKRYRGYNS